MNEEQKWLVQDLLVEQLKQQSLKVFHLNLQAFQVSKKGDSPRRAHWYRNWIIKPIAQDKDWLVAYCTTAGEIFIDAQTYDSAEAALTAARERVDRNIAGFALLEFLFELYEARKIDTQQYSRLANSLIREWL
ncbi:MAG TPA: hypothetical protein V6D03_00240 [Candidatus Caenarcaniphilales bacterium]